MIKKTVGVSILLLFVITVSITLLSCAGGNEAKRLGETMISGDVEIESSSVKKPLWNVSSMLAYIKKSISLTKLANAQSGDILVIAFQDGAEVDRDTVDGEGNFELSVPRGGDVSLRFEASDFTATTLIAITPESVVTLKVSLTPGSSEVEIEDFEIVSVPIHTREVEGFIFDEERANLTIDGGGENCIRATGTSNVNIDVNDLTLTDCNEGIDGEDFANVSLEAVGVPTLSISAERNGVHAKDDSSIRIKGTDIFITGGTNGILATGTSGVEVNPSGDCEIRGVDEAVDERDAAVVTTAECSLSRLP